MKSTHKQTALKASLFMLLAANVSWHTPNAHKQMMQSNDFASELGTNGGAAASAVTPGAPLAVVKVEPPPAGTTAAITTTPVSSKSSKETQKFCGVDFEIQFHQESEAGKNILLVDVYRTSPRKAFRGLRMNGTYASRVEDAASKENLLDLVRVNTIADLKTLGVSCDSPVVTVPAPSPESPTAPPSNDRERVSRGLKACMSDAAGKPLRDYFDRDGMFHSERFDCNLKRLEAISLDTGSVGEEEEIGGDRRTTRRKRDRGARSGLASVQEALDPLENVVRSLLTSSKDDRREEGETRLDDLISSLQVVADTASNSDDERAMKKMIDTLQKAYPLGEKVDKIADAYSAKLDVISTRLSDLQSSMIGANMYQQQSIRMQMDNLQTARLNMQQALQWNPDIVKLQQYQQQGLLSQGDYTDFSADYFALMQGSMANSASALAMAPNGLSQARSTGLVDRGSGGWVAPAFPTLNYSNLGLNNPAIAGGTNPMFPSTNGYPQTSGYPVTTGFNQGMPNSNMPMNLPTNIPISQGQGQFQGQFQGQYQPQYQGQQQYQPGYNPTVMSVPGRI